MDNKHIIKEFRSYVDSFVECCTSDHETHELLKAVDKLIEEQEERIDIMSEGGWIPIALKPPKADRNKEPSIVSVIATTGRSVFPVYWCGRIIRGKWVERWETSNGLYWGDEIIAWMPIPKPPKRGEA